MARVRFLTPCLFALALVALLGAPAGAVPPDPASAVAYLDAQQVAGTDATAGAGSWDEDTGFGLSEFSTTEVVLAIASAAQSGGSWNPTEARIAVETTVNGDGLNALAYLDDLAQGGLSPAEAGKLLLLVALPLDDDTAGFDPAAWDPAGDGSPVDLVAALGGCADVTDYGFFGQTTVAMQAVAVLCGQAGPAATQTVRDAQQDNGGWSFDGDPSGATEAEIDVTAMAMLALVAGGVRGDDPAMLDGLAYLAERQTADGWWASLFDPASPDATSRALLAIVAAGWDPATPAWRDHVLPQAAGTPYVSPDDGLGALQQGDGSIVGPTTFSAVYSTAQSVQATERTWLPVATTTAPSFDDSVGPPPDPDAPEEPEGVAGDVVEPDSGATLPRTGAPALPLALAGLGAITTGAVLLRMRRA